MIVSMRSCLFAMLDSWNAKSPRTSTVIFFMRSFNTLGLHVTLLLHYDW